MSIRWIFISPHLDDAVLSCGGMMAELAARGDHTEVWTIFAGDPPDKELTPFAMELHNRWGVTSGQLHSEMRRREDEAACRLLGAEYLHFDWPDCIYRRQPGTGEPVVPGEDQLWTRDNEPETYLEENIKQKFNEVIHPGDHMIIPMGLGNHRDHLLVRDALEMGRENLYYYADYPYVISDETNRDHIREFFKRVETHRITDERISLWIEAVAAYQSQLSTFWGSRKEMTEAIRAWAGYPESALFWRG